MKLLRCMGIACLILSAISIQAQSDDKPKKQAKELYEKAMKESNDRGSQARDVCQAAQLQSREKKYTDACNNDRAALSHDDQGALEGAQAAYKSHDLEKAESLAKQVSSFDPRTAGQAKSLLETIKGERSSAQGVEEIKAAWLRGDFSTVMTLAPTMTTQASQATASLYVKDVNLYNDYIENASSIQATNPQRAIDILGYAYTLNPHGPVDVNAKIAELQKVVAAKNNSQYFQAGAKGSTGPAAGPLSTADAASKVNKLLNDARTAEKQGNSADALNSYQAVLKLQPDNSEARSHAAKLQVAIKNDPKAAASELRSAIRDFYQAQFDTARTALLDYLESPQTAKNPGAADFYLGATLIERSILRTPQGGWKGPSDDALTALKAARKANYKPVRAYVSPMLLKIWDSVGE